MFNLIYLDVLQLLRVRPDKDGKNWLSFVGKIHQRYIRTKSTHKLMFQLGAKLLAVAVLERHRCEHDFQESVPDVGTLTLT